MGNLMGESSGLLARRSDLIRKLIEGDPVAWVILVVVIGIFVAIKVIKSRMG